MRKTLIYKKRVQDETGREYILWYSLVIRVAEHGRIYGVEIEKTNEYGRQERALIAGISEEKKETREQKRGISSLHRWRFLFLCIFHKNR